MKGTILVSEHKEVVSMNALKTALHNVTVTQAKRKASSMQENNDSVMVLRTLQDEVIASKSGGKWKDTSLANLLN